MGLKYIRWHATTSRMANPRRPSILSHLLVETRIDVPFVEPTPRCSARIQLIWWVRSSRNLPISVFGSTRITEADPAAMEMCRCSKLRRVFQHGAILFVGVEAVNVKAGSRCHTGEVRSCIPSPEIAR